MGIFVGDTAPSKIYVGGSEVASVWAGDTKVRPTTPPYLCFTANTASSTVTLGIGYGSPAAVNLETSTDGSNWSSYTIGNTITLSNIGDKVYFRNTSETDTQFTTSMNDRYQFTMTGSISGSGDITTLLNKNGTDTLSDYCFINLFYGCSSLRKPPQLPATTLGARCYFQMFYNCSNLIECPELPATTLTERCYRDMFSGCTSFTTAPELPATSLAAYCYDGMFYGCTSLTTAPELPATSLAGNCYSSMFKGCTSLATAPELKATELYERCYFSMFSGCTSLTALTKLPATSLANYCYNSMFSGCTKINLSTTQTGDYQTSYRIPTTGTGTVGTNSLNNMFNNTGGTFTGTPSINTTYYTSNTVV